MKILSTLVASIALVILSGCALADFPKFPEKVKFQYVTLVDGEGLPEGFSLSVVNPEEIATLSASVACLKFEIIQPYPYKIKYLSEVPVTDCNGVGGFQPKDAVTIFTWMDDVHAWAEERKKCLK